MAGAGAQVRCNDWLSSPEAVQAFPTVRELGKETMNIHERQTREPTLWAPEAIQIGSPDM